jgi:hypothetical protein
VTLDASMTAVTLDVDAPITMAFVGHADPATGAAASAFEDEVLPLLAEHGGRVLYRGRRIPGQDAGLPWEVHLLWFPRRAALDAYLADDRRSALLARHGETFTSKQAVELETLVPLP